MRDAGRVCSEQIIFSCRQRTPRLFFCLSVYMCVCRRATTTALGVWYHFNECRQHSITSSGLLGWCTPCLRLVWLFTGPPSHLSPQSVLVQLQLLMAELHHGRNHIPERGGEGVSGLPPLIKGDMRLWLSFDTVVLNSCMETETSAPPGVESNGSLRHALTFSKEAWLPLSSQILQLHHEQWHLFTWYSGKNVIFQTYSKVKVRINV